MALQVTSAYIPGGTIAGSTLVSVIPTTPGVTRCSLWVWTGDSADNNILQLMFGAVVQALVPNRFTGNTWADPAGHLTLGPYVVTGDGVTAVSAQNVSTTIGAMIMVLCVDNVGGAV